MKTKQELMKMSIEELQEYISEIEMECCKADLEYERLYNLHDGINRVINTVDLSSDKEVNETLVVMETMGVFSETETVVPDLTTMTISEKNELLHQSNEFIFMASVSGLTVVIGLLIASIIAIMALIQKLFGSSGGGGGGGGGGGSSHRSHKRKGPRVYKPSSEVTTLLNNKSRPRGMCPIKMPTDITIKDNGRDVRYEDYDDWLNEFKDKGLSTTEQILSVRDVAEGQIINELKAILNDGKMSKADAESVIRAYTDRIYVVTRDHIDGFFSTDTIFENSKKYLSSEFYMQDSTGFREALKVNFKYAAISEATDAIMKKLGFTTENVVAALLNNFDTEGRTAINTMLKGTDMSNVTYVENLKIEDDNMKMFISVLKDIKTKELDYANFKTNYANRTTYNGVSEQLIELYSCFEKQTDNIGDVVLKMYYDGSDKILLSFGEDINKIYAKIETGLKSIELQSKTLDKEIGNFKKDYVGEDDYENGLQALNVLQNFTKVMVNTARHVKNNITPLNTDIGKIANRYRCSVPGYNNTRSHNSHGTINSLKLIDELVNMKFK